MAPFKFAERAGVTTGIDFVVSFALGAAVAGIVANMAGFSEGLTVEAAKQAAFWVFAAFIPLSLVANVAAWKLTR